MLNWILNTNLPFCNVHVLLILIDQPFEGRLLDTVPWCIDIHCFLYWQILRLCSISFAITNNSATNTNIYFWWMCTNFSDLHGIQNSTGTWLHSWKFERRYWMALQKVTVIFIPTDPVENSLFPSPLANLEITNLFTNIIEIIGALCYFVGFLITYIFFWELSVCIPYSFFSLLIYRNQWSDLDTCDLLHLYFSLHFV